MKIVNIRVNFSPWWIIPFLVMISCDYAYAGSELLYVDIAINGQPCPGVFAVVLHDTELWVATAQIDQLQLKDPSGFSKRDMFDQSFSLLPASITYEVDRAALVLRLTVSADDMPETVIADQAERISISPKTYAFYWNYHLSLFHDPLVKTVAFESAHKPVFATPFGSFINQFLTNLGAINRIVRLETAYELDVPKADLRIVAGDSATDAPSWGNHVAMAGIKLQKDFLFQTGVLSYPTVILEGYAPRRGEAEIWLNETLRQSKDLPRGGFLLDNLSLPAGSHKGILVVRDPSGIVSQTPFSYYADPQLLRPGTQSYSYNLGFLRKDYGIKSFQYGGPVFFGSHKIGLTNFWSPGFHTEMTRGIALFGTEQRFGLWNFGSMATGGAFSLTPVSPGYVLSQEFNLNIFRVLINAHGQWSSANFQPVGIERDMTKDPIYLLSGSLRLDLPYVNQTSLSYLLVHRKIPRINSVGLKQGLPLFNNLALSFSGEYDFLKNNFGFYGFIGAQLPWNHNISAQGTKRGRTYGGSTSLSMNPNPAHNVRVAYNVSAGYEKFAYGQGDFSLDTKYVINRWSAFGAKNQFNYMGELNGAFGGIKDQLFFSRPISGGILLIEMPDQKNVGVWKDNNVYLGKTNKHGQLVVTDLKPYETTRMGFSVKDFDLSTKSSSSSQEVTVTAGSQSAHRVSLSAPVVRNIQFRLIRGNERLASGTLINVENLEQTFVMSDGRIFLEVPHEIPSITGVNEEGDCKFNVQLPPTINSLVEEIGDIPCK